MLVPANRPSPAAITELSGRPQWVVWFPSEHEGRPPKAPFDAKSGRPASHSDPRTWASHAAALEFSENYEDAGQGFVLSARDPYVGIDLDACVDREPGEVAPWAREIVEALRSYTEVSPGGAGLHIWLRGTLPAGGRRRGTVEMYDRERYLTVTGRHLAGTPETIEERTA